MTEKPEQNDQPFKVVFEALKAAKTGSPEAPLVQLMRVIDEDRLEWGRIDELRRLSEFLAEPELRTYTAS